MADLVRFLMTCSLGLVPCVMIVHKVIRKRAAQRLQFVTAQSTRAFLVFADGSAESEPRSTNLH